MDLLHAHGDSPLSLRLSLLVPFAIRICSLRSRHPSANPPNFANGEFSPLSLSIKKPHLWWSFFMERETRLELATSSLARRHSTTELPPHRVTLLVLHKQFFFASVFFIYAGIASSCSLSIQSMERTSISSLSLNCCFNVFTSSFELSTQNTDAARIFTSSLSSFNLKVTGSEP